MMAQEFIVPKKQTQKGFVKLDFLSIAMPEHPIIIEEPNMGFTGIHYLLDFNRFYAGLGMYGTVSGIRGGFFTLGIDAGFKTKLTNQLFLDTGFHFGGGGGAGAPDGGGAFILPHLNIGYEFPKFSLTGGYSYINFFDGGAIQSQQATIGLQIPLSFDYSDTISLDKKYTLTHLQQTDWNQDSKKISMMMHLNNLSPIGSSQNTDPTPISLAGKTVRLAGFELNTYLRENFFLFFKVDGAYSGIRGGYMDVLAGAGYELAFYKKRTKIVGKFGMGAGGGGGVDTQGGFLIYPDISLEQKIYKDVFVSINKGYLLSPNAHFKATTFGLGIKYYSNINGTTSLDKFSQGSFNKHEIVIKQDVYFNAKRNLLPTEDLHQISLQINFYLNKHFYVAGQTSFANFGNAGAYAEGIVGAGIKSSPIFKKKINLFAQILGGAAGGGDISTGEGLILKPSVGIQYQFNSEFSIQTALGYVKAKQGALSSSFINLGVTYEFSLLRLLK